MALPSSDDSIRGMTVDGWIVADEAARLSPELIARAPPDAGADAGAVCHAVDGLEPDRSVLGDLERRRSELDSGLRPPPTWWISLGPSSWRVSDAVWARRRYNREFLGIPESDQASPFTWASLRPRDRGPHAVGAARASVSTAAGGARGAATQSILDPQTARNFVMNLSS